MLGITGGGGKSLTKVEAEPSGGGGGGGGPSAETTKLFALGSTNRFNLLDSISFSHSAF